MRQIRHCLVLLGLFILGSIAQAKEPVPATLALEFGSDLEHSEEVFMDLELGTSHRHRLQFGLGQANTETALDTDYNTRYYRAGFATDPYQAVIYRLSYDYWDIEDIYTSDTVAAAIEAYWGNWVVGLHPELRYLSVKRQSDDLRIGFRNPGIGLSLGYEGVENISLYASYYHYDYSHDPKQIKAESWTQLVIESILRVISVRVASDFDAARATVGMRAYVADYSLGIEYSDAVAALDDSRYHRAMLSVGYLFGRHWAGEVAWSSYGGELIENSDYYTVRLTYQW